MARASLSWRSGRGQRLTAGPRATSARPQKGRRMPTSRPSSQTAVPGQPLNTSMPRITEQAALKIVQPDPPTPRSWKAATAFTTPVATK